MGITNSYFAPVVYFFAAMLFMGMMELGSQLADPFGDDDVDYPVSEWLSECSETCTVLVEFHYPGWDDSFHQHLQKEPRLSQGARIHVSTLQRNRAASKETSG